MWYAGDSGRNARIGYARSDDGRSWTKYEKNPILDLGPPGSWDDTNVSDPAVILEETTYRMWYSGNDGNIRRIGYTTSEKLNPWIKYQSNPEVLDAYVVTGIIEDLTYTIELDVPLTGDFDLHLFSRTGGRDDAIASSVNPGAGSDESITFSATFSDDYIIVITNENGGTGLYTIVTTSPPIPTIMGRLVAEESGTISLEMEASYPSSTDDPGLFPYRRVAVSPDGSLLVGGWDTRLTLFKTESKVPLWTLDINEFPTDFKFSDNGENLVVFGEKTLYYFHTSSCIPLWFYEDIGYHPISYSGNRMDMSRDGRFIATKAYGNRVLVFDTTSTTPTVPYWEHDFGDEVVTVKISGDGNYLVMGGKHDHELRLGWIPGKSIEWTYSSNDPFHSAAISKYGTTISFGQGIQHNVGVFNHASNTPEWTYELEGVQAQQAMSDDGSYFVSANMWDSTPNTWSGWALWDTSNSDPVWEFQTGQDISTRVDCVAMDRQAQYVVGGDFSGDLYLFSQHRDRESGWSNSDGTPIYNFTARDGIYSNAVSISADGTYFAAGSKDGSIYLFTTIEGQHLLWEWNPLYKLPAAGNCSWDFDAKVDSDGDGDFTNDGDFYGPNLTHTYERSGNYTVTLTLTTEEGVVHSYTMFVTVDVSETSSGGLLNDVVGPGLPLAGIALMVGLILSLFFGKTEVGNYRMIPIIFPLYSRLRKNELLDQDTRSLIYRHIMENPGDNYNKIRETLNLNNGTLAYHLKTLERENYIKSMRDGRYKRFYPVDVKVQRVNGFGTGSVQGRIMVYLMGNPGLSQREISGALNLSQQVVSYHLKFLIETGHIRARREGKNYRYSVNETVPWRDM
jgi:DNA-binding MarR family transcriptional regulator/WD40 repeat protein